jgi:hypothetical protein
MFAGRGHNIQMPKLALRFFTTPHHYFFSTLLHHFMKIQHHHGNNIGILWMEFIVFAIQISRNHTAVISPMLKVERFTKLNAENFWNSKELISGF